MKKEKSQMIMQTLVFALGALAIYAGEASAYGEKVEGALKNSLGWTIRVVGVFVAGFGLLRGGMKLASHDKEGINTVIWAIVGGIVILLVPTIMDLIQSWAK